MKKWTFKDAYKAKYGKDAPLPSHENVKASWITEIDRFIASSLGVSDQESLKKIHAALAAAIPILTTHSYPSIEEGKNPLRHAADHAIECVKAYCKADGVPRSDYQPVLRALKSLDFSNLGSYEWFMIWDAMGTEGEINDQECYEFYMHAGRCWHYETLAVE